MTENFYPLGHQSDEVGRLEIQAQLFEDPILAQLAKDHSNCLEIGAGVGSNLRSLRRANPRMTYLGVDFSSLAIKNARKLHPELRTHFQVMNATELDFPPGSFDLVFSKLVLWSIGANWKKALSEAYRVLKPGGSFYAFEPLSKAMVFHPPRPALESLIEKWDESASKRGLDTHIGSKVPFALEQQGFKNIEASFFPVPALQHDHERYRAICDNLRKFYFGDSLKDLRLESTSIQAALKELVNESPGQMVLDAFLVVTAVK